MMKYEIDSDFSKIARQKAPSNIYPGLSVSNDKAKHNIVAAAIVTTALFTALHGGAFEAGVVPVLNVLTMSLLMTVVLEYSGSIIAPTIMHFLWNGISVLVLGGVSLADDYPNLLITTFTGNEILSKIISAKRKEPRTNSE